MERANLQVIDPRIILKGYAALAFPLGLLLVGWGPMWLPTDAASTRILGSLLIAAACCSVPIARVDEPVACRRGLLWFAGAHAVVMAVLMLQQQTIPGSPILALTLRWLQLMVMFFAFFWMSSRATSAPWLTSLFARPGKDSTAVLRSRYEQEIREAAGQEERNRLARELHDSIKQQIFVIQTAAATAQTRLESDATGTREALEQVRGSARAASAELEAMLSQLRAEPLTNEGLVEAIRRESEALGFRTGAKVECHIGKLPPNEWLAPGAHRAVLRVAQESLANIGRHARASHVTVSLAALSETLELKIEDDGQGFDMMAVHQGMGLRNMRERAEEFDGTVEVVSRPAGGTTVLLAIPVEAVDKPRVYLRKMVLMAALAVFFLVLTVMGRAGTYGLPIIAVLYFLMNLTAYIRVRKARV